MKTSADQVIARDRVIGKPLADCHPERVRVEFSETSTSRRIPISPVHTASASSHERFSKLRSWLWNAGELLRAAVLEIFDESAYQRFLERTGLSHSTKSYRAFVAERDSLAATKPRCC